MNPLLEKLCRIADKDSRRIVGLMSGTSLDGLDVALCRLTGYGPDTKLEVLDFATEAYGDDYRDAVRAVFSKRDVDLQAVTLLNAWIGRQHAEIVLACLRRWQVPPDSVDLLASHGQTIYHCPKHLHRLQEFPDATLQVGDGDHLALATGILTCSDFRQKHVAAGGEGAPLAMYGDYFLFSSPRRDRIMLNIGGIANFTLLPKSLDPGEVVCSDVGPGNTLMDALVQKECDGLLYDADAQLARKGAVSDALLEALRADSFFALPAPKTIGPELFNLDYLHAAMERSGTLGLSLEDQLATLNRLSADSIVSAIRYLGIDMQTLEIYVSGGGAHNPLLVQHIERQLDGVTLRSTSDLGVDPDAKEAVVFAVLANECVAGAATRLGRGNETMQAITMGKISLPG